MKKISNLGTPFKSQGVSQDNQAVTVLPDIIQRNNTVIV